MHDHDTPTVARPGKRRAAKPIADDHVPAMLAAAVEGASPVVTSASAVEPALEAAPADPVPAPPAAVPAAPAIEDIMDTAQTTTETVDAAASQGHAMFADMNTRAKTAMERGQKLVDEMNALSKGHVEAMVESSKIAVKGFESLSQDAAEFARRHFEGATEAMKTLAATKSPTEFLKLQGDYARSTFDTLVAETSRSTERMIKLANDVAQPISNRIAVAAEKAKLAA